MSKMGLVLLVAVCLAVSAHLSSGQATPAPAPSLDCSGEELELLPCLSFLTNSSVTTAPPSCCTALTNVSTASPACLCQFISPGSSNEASQLGVNATKALELPTICGLAVSPSQCTALLGPVAAPAPSAAVPVLSPTAVPEALRKLRTAWPVIAAAPSGGCGPALLALAPCLSYLAGTRGSPLDACCSGFPEVLETSFACVCDLIGPGGSSSIPGINFTTAMELPTVCNASAEVLSCTAVSPVAGAAPTPGVETPLSAPLSSVSPGPAADCTVEIESLAPCLEFLNGKDVTPPSDCCTPFGEVVETAPSCLCSLLSSGSSASIPGINETRALELPALCKVSASLSSCAIGSPASSPAGQSSSSNSSGAGLGIAVPPFMAVAFVVAASSWVLQSVGAELLPSLFC